MADEVKIPDREEILQLPRQARVAFAARCARRVLPLFKTYWPAAPQKHVLVVRHAVECAERHAGGRNQAELTIVVSDADAAANAVGTNESIDSIRAHKAFCAAQAAKYAVAVAEASAPSDLVAEAIEFAVRAASVAADAAIRADFDRLLALTKKEEWTADTPVPPWVFGPMWPLGAPKGWPEADPEEKLIVTLAVPSEATTAEIAALRSKLYDQLDRLVRAEGGPGLTLDGTEDRLTINVLVGGGV